MNGWIESDNGGGAMGCFCSWRDLMADKIDQSFKLVLYVMRHHHTRYEPPYDSPAAYYTKIKENLKIRVQDTFRFERKS
jgi:hypothetical protein